MAPPGSFNDPFDCKIPMNYHLLDTEDKKNEYADAVIARNRLLIDSSQSKSELDRKKLLERLNDLDKLQSEHEELEFSAYNNHFGVFSLSHRWDSILMWSHYADNHRGFVIGYNLEKLKGSDIFAQGGPVSYVDEFPNMDPITDSAKFESSIVQLFSKAKDWQYEEEYRLVNLFYPQIPSNDDRNIKLPIDFIDEVVIGLDINNNDKTSIFAFCQERSISLFKIIKTPFMYSLARERLL